MSEDLHQIKNTKSPIEKIGQKVEQVFLRKENMSGHKYMPWYSLEIVEMQIKITSRYYFTPTRLAKLMYWRIVAKTELESTLMGV